jgi:hypothetical protein
VGNDDPVGAQLEAARDLRTNFPDRGCGQLPPLIIVPGVTASTIQFKLTNSPPPPGHPLCSTSSNGKWEQLYPPPNPLPTLGMDCYISEFTSTFANGTFRPSRTGEETRVLDFGGFDGMPSWVGEGLWPYEISGWEAGKTMFAAPFDWRLPSPALDDMYTQLKDLVESVSKSNDGRKVLLWGFSGGPQPALAFLHRQTQAWKDEYVAWFAASSPVWSGMPAALAFYADGSANVIANPSAEVRSPLLPIPPPPPPPRWAQAKHLLLALLRVSLADYLCARAQL